MDFSSLIGPEAWLELTRCYREQRIMARPQAFPARFRALWSDWEFEALCRFTLLAETDTYRMIARGKQVPDAAFRGKETAVRMATVRQLWETGVSVNFARFELYSNPVLALIRSVEAALHCPARAHYFATPGQSQALGVHADHEDVLVLQIEGEKTWDVYPGSNSWPAQPEVAKKLLGEHRPETLTLGTGGWLFLPKGVYHEVRNESGAPSRHFTIGFHRLTWGLALERALGLARAELRDLRDTLEVAGPDNDRGARADAHLSALRPFIDRAMAAERYGERLAPRAIVDRAKLDTMELRTRLLWSHDEVRVEERANRLEIGLPYRSVALHLRPELAPLLTFMQRSEEFAPGELAETGTVAVLFCKFLANVGVLQLVSGQR